MKLVLVLLFTISSAFAATGDVLLTCTKTSFQDLNKIVITEGADVTILVTEYDEKNIATTTKRAFSDITTDGVQLSDWAGYTRLLNSDGSGWYISYHDECSGGIVTVTCK